MHMEEKKGFPLKDLIQYIEDVEKENPVTAEINKEIIEKLRKKYK